MRLSLRGAPASPQRSSLSGAQLWLLAGGVLVTCGLVSLMVLPDGIRQPILVGLTGLVIAGFLVSRGLQGRWDPFEPIVIALVGCFVILFLRPVWMWAAGEWTFSIFDLRDGLTGAATISLVGVVSLIVGYSMGTGRKIGERLHPIRDDWDPARVTNACLVLFVLAALLFSFYIGTSGGLGTLKSYFSGRSGLDRTLGTSSTTGKASSYFALSSSMLIPIALVMTEVWRRTSRPRYTVVAVVCIGAALAITVPRGDRTILLVLLLPLVSLPFILRGKTPRMRSLVAGTLVAILLFNVLLGFRTQEQRQGGLFQSISTAVTQPTKQINDFMLGVDMAMYSVLSAEYTVVPDNLDYMPGQAATSLVLLPIPGPLWPGKPLEPSQLVYAELFPVTASQTRAGFGPSIFGSFYADSGFIGVAIYSLLVGIGLRAMYAYYQANRWNRTVCVLFAALLPIIIIMLRASLSLAIGGSLFLIAPIPIAFWWGNRRRVVKASRKRAVVA